MLPLQTALLNESRSSFLASRQIFPGIKDRKHFKASAQYSTTKGYICHLFIKKKNKISLALVMIIEHNCAWYKEPRVGQSHYIHASK